MAASAGCHGSPPPPSRPALVPAEVARRAIEMYDANHDGKIDAEELKKSPALAALAANLGPQAAEGLSGEDLARRAEAWLTSPSALVYQTLVLDLDSRPLAGATVAVEPEECMGPGYQAVTATTDAMGQCCPSGADARYGGLHPGLYRIRVSKVDGRETIPARYNTQTELGLETDPTPRSRSAFLRLHLHSQ
jgi:hypothetical protein